MPGDYPKKMRDASNRRTYTILAVIGQGGFGTVYRATMEGPDGFRKEVAVKLMQEREMASEGLMRFRDEARILGLVRDRAIVSVDPPTHLNGRLAIVMEYIEGASAAALMHQNPFPAGVALEIIQEVARVLDKVVRHPGPDGRPLNLLHRDLKPGNLQITPGGEVKILDFGIARATFDAREAHTVSNVAGTIGYIAPERLSGVEAPPGDIYSLGVLLHVLITRDKAVTHAVFQERGAQVPRTAAVVAALALALEMCHVDPAWRPTARQVEDRCQYLRQLYPAMTLRAWAETHVPANTTLAPDDLVGATLSETIAIVTRDAPRPDGTAVLARRVAVGRAEPRLSRQLLTGLLGASLGALSLGAVGVGWALSGTPRASGQTERFTAQIAGPPPIGIAEPPPIGMAEPPALGIEPLADDEPAPGADVADGALLVDASPAPARAVSAKPLPPDLSPPTGPSRPARIAPNATTAVPAPSAANAAAPSAASTAAPSAAPPATSVAPPTPALKPSPPVLAAPLSEVPAAAEAAGPVWAMTFASVPGGARVSIDGVRIGTAPILNYPLSTGSFTVSMLAPGGASIVRTIQTGDRAPTRYVWDQPGGGTWNSY